jgi:hypothetical protein
MRQYHGNQVCEHGVIFPPQWRDSKQDAIDSTAWRRIFPFTAAVPFVEPGGYSCHRFQL